MEKFSLKSAGRVIALAGIAAVWAIAPGCATAPPQQYYTLDMRPSETVNNTVAISVGMINVAEPLAQKNVLIQKSPTEIEFYAIGQWIGGLDELLREKLKAEFGMPAAPKRDMTMTADLLAFEQVDPVADAPGGAQAHIKIDVELRDAGKSRYTPALLKKTYNVRVPSKDASVNGIVVALSSAVEQLAVEIAADAAKL